MSVPAALATAWRQCAPKVSGVWRLSYDGQVVHRHPGHWLFLVPLAGSADVHTASEVVPLAVGQVLLVPPGQRLWGPCSADFTTIHALVVPLIRFETDLAWQQLRLPAVVTLPSAIPALAEFVDAIAQKTWRDPGLAVAARLAVDRLLWEWLQVGFATGSLQLDQPRPAWLADVVRAAEHECTQVGFGIPDFVRLAGCSHEHLCRLLRRFDNCTPKQFIRRLRVQRLLHLVRNEPELGNDSLAERCGFAAVRTMTRQVQQETGRSLRQLRQGASGSSAVG